MISDSDAASSPSRITCSTAATEMSVSGVWDRRLVVTRTRLLKGVMNEIRRGGVEGVDQEPEISVATTSGGTFCPAGNEAAMRPCPSSTMANGVRV
jgi:hypothetical protein